MATSQIVRTNKASKASIKPPMSPGQKAVRAFIRNRIAVIGFALVILVIACAIIAPSIAPFDPRDQSIFNRLRAPSSTNLLGTDRFGRDVLSRLLHGARVSLTVGLISVFIGGLIGTAIGIYSGYRGGRFDRSVMGLVDVMLSFPDLLVGILVIIVIGPGIAGVVAAISFAMLPKFIRVARGPTLSLRQSPFIEASTALGARPLRTLSLHILPNIFGQVLVVSTLWIASAIRVEASLSFLGLGVQPPAPTWGNMIRDGLGNIFTAPWLAIFPSAAIMITVLAFNLFGDGLRDVIDPKSTK